MWHDIKLLNALANALFGLVLLLLFAAGCWWVAQRPVFTLETIRVEGVQQVPLRYVSGLTIRTTALPRIRGNFFTADLDVARMAFEAVPWVRKAAVRREWPNTLIVALEEHVPLGTWGGDGKLVSVKGDVFTANLAEAEEDGALPQLSGPPGSEKEVAARFHDVRRWLARIDLKPAVMQLSDRYAWTVGFENGMTVELGRERKGETLQARVERLVKIYPQLVARLQDRIDSVDLRYPNGLALNAKGLIFGSDEKKIASGTI